MALKSAAILASCALLACSATARAGLADSFARTASGATAQEQPAKTERDPFVGVTEPTADPYVQPAGFQNGIFHHAHARSHNLFLSKGYSGPNDPSGFTYSWAPDRWAHVGAAIRASFNSTTTRDSRVSGNYFTLNNARLMTSGQITDIIGYELNSDVNLANGITNSGLALPSSYNLLDAIVKIETSDLFHIWMGQFLPPSDRSNIDGPFHINGFVYPFVSRYPAVFQGRQIGAAYWGELNGGQVQWSMGLFNGFGAALMSPYTNPPFSPPNTDNNIGFNARLNINLLDPEPGYYHASTYYGKKDLLAIGFALHTEHDGAGTSRNPRNFTALNMDAVYETTLADGGVVTLEGALYYYDDNDLVTSYRQGTSGFLYGGYMFPQVFSVGKIHGRFRPFVRYQKYNHDYLVPSAGLFSQGVDVGTEYVINGANAHLMAAWGNREVIGEERIQKFIVGAQVIF